MWSTVRSRFRERLAPELVKLVDVHVAGYGRGRFTMGRGWVTYRGVEVLSVDATMIWSARIGSCVFGLKGSSIGRAAACIPQLAIERALSSVDTTVRGLSLLDRRVGRSRLMAAAQGSLHPIEAILLAVRLHAIGLRDDLPACPMCSKALFDRPTSGPPGRNCYQLWEWLDAKSGEAS